MYQFPDSSEAMGEQEPEPLKTGARYRIIIIANLLLALLVIMVVWFVFFFKSESTNSSTVDLPLATKTKGDFTPIIIEDDNVGLMTALEEDEMISPIIETVAIPVSNGETINLEPSPTVVSNKTKDSNKAPQEKQQNTSTLSAIDLIANEMMRSTLTKSEVKLDKKQMDNTPLVILSPQPISIKNTPQLQEPQVLQKNQINLDQTTPLPLEELLQRTQQTLTHSDQQLVKDLKAVDTLQPNKTTANSNEVNINKTSTGPNTVIYNSIPLNTGSDIDKIMAAMGNTKTPAVVETADKIDKAVKKLLKNEESKSKETVQYIEKLQSETEENRKAIRTITVKEGEKLWDIAVRAYGDGNKYKKILQANPLLKTNPELIKAGVTLRAPL